ncbi:hypothetical protein LB523_12265 [Mesorhizobium sp. ESP-6-4]|uniref:hypothetical protein n=1 Tax=Mesorhizobium sp. ESP-6-4 TaxID=2876624 RepID=UPI001CCB97CE|nr:hypothetical protein [Mesorhizobium sp. ESP-6-4]MBZ9659821.1 hypothetical protein [Mesorhizobium sp. ESP-6-4]
MSEAEKDLALGERVMISGVVVGSSRFVNGDVTYSVEYERKGRSVTEWFCAEDLIPEQQDGDGI